MSNLFLPTPGIWYPGQSEKEWEEEVELMILRANATDAFSRGEVDADWFLNFLHELGTDVFTAAEGWAQDEQLIV